MSATPEWIWAQHTRVRYRKLTYRGGRPEEGMQPICEQCTNVATVYAIDPHPGGWGGRYCEPCAKALGFKVVDRL
jgi:hypothetical protein